MQKEGRGKVQKEDQGEAQRDGFLRHFFVCLGVQVVSWGLLTLCDWIEETGGEDLFAYVCLLTPVVLSVLYFCLRKKLYGVPEIPMKQVLQFCGMWLAQSCVFGVLLTVLAAGWNRWIVRQATEGWEHFLNGLEYPMFGFLLGAIPLLAVLLGEAVIRVVPKVISKK